VYKSPREVRKDIHPYLRLQENAVLHGQQVVRAIEGMSRNGFRPDLVIGHPGWGELLFVKDVLPNVPLISYCEFFYRGKGLDVGFDPEDPADIDAICRSRARSSHLLLSLESCDLGISPTHWQKSVHPAAFQDKIHIAFDGIDTDAARPNGPAKLRLPDEAQVNRGDEILTYVARNLEPYRGFRTFTRALPHILAKRPSARVVVVGGNDVSYGSKPGRYKNWRDAMLAEVDLDLSRVHFTGKLPYLDYLKLLRASRAHVYLTYPFVLSWSCLEAMACGALVIGSDTPPVREVLQHDQNGIITDFFDQRALADRVIDALAKPDAYMGHRQAARQTALRYSLEVSLPRQLNLIAMLMGSSRPSGNSAAENRGGVRGLRGV